MFEKPNYYSYNSDNRLKPNSNNGYNSNYSASKEAFYAEVDDAVRQCGNLVVPQYVKWHYRKAYEIGCPRYLQLARMASEGRNPQRLFVYLLNKG